MVQHKRDPLVDLEALARETDDLRPTDELTDVVIDAIDPAGETLARAARETSDLAPSDGFTSAVMRKVGIESTEPAWPSGVVQWARAALFSAAAAAALSLLLSRYAETAFDSTILEGVASVEVDE